MSVILKIDESPSDQAGTQDISLALPTKLNSDLTTLLGAGYSVLEAAVSDSASALSFGPNMQSILFTNSSGVELNGVDSGLIAIDGRQISLYTYGPDNNLVIGREDNADGTANASGAVVFAIYLETNGTAGDENFDTNATSANVWVVQFSSLQHYLNTDVNNAAYNDFNDIVTLANKLFVTASNPVSFNADHSPSGSNLFITFGDGTPSATETSVIATAVGAANQSLTGSISGGAVVKTSQAGPDATFGVNSQMFDPPSASKPTAEAMYFTFVKGVVPGLTVPNLSPGEADLESNIQFTNYVGTTSISFSIAQLQPSSSMATMEIYALVATPNGANGAGIADDGVWSGNSYIDHQDDNTSVNITSITVTRNGTPIVFNASGSDSGITVNFSPGDDANAATISGLLAGDKITYVSATEHDRLEIKNIGNVDPGLNASFDIGGLTMVTGGTATSPFPDLQFVDDGPALGLSTDVSKPNDLQVDNDLNDSADSTDNSFYVLTPGSDGQKSYSILGPEDTTGTFRWHYTTAGDPTAITGTFVDANSVSHNLYTLVLNSSTGAYTFTMTGTLPPKPEGLTSTIIHAGGPTDQIDVQAEAPSTDFGRIIGDSTVGAGNINASHGFVGVDNGNLDPDESINLSLHKSDGSLILISGISIGTKSAQDGTYNYILTMSDNSTVEIDDVLVHKGDPIVVTDPNPNDALLIKSVTVEMVDGNALKIGLGDIDFLVPPDDVQLGFTLRLTDGDNDFTDRSFTVDIDGNNDGSFDATANASLVVNSATLSAIETLHHQEFADPHDAFAF